MGRSSAVTIILFFCLAAACFGQKHSASPLRHNSPACGISFAVPARWTVKAVAPCQFLLRPRHVPQPDDEGLYDLNIYAVRGDLNVAADADEGYFERRPEGWVVFAPGLSDKPEPATPIKGNGWRGVEADTSKRCYHAAGGYAGLCDVFVALIGNEKHSAMLDGGPQAEDAFHAVLKSLRFLE